ncbi:4-vinyl reductase [Natrialbaceae archaeon A-arb3/5]
MATISTILPVSSWIKRLVGSADESPHSSDGLPTVHDRIGFDGELDGSEVIGRSPQSYIAAGDSVSSFVGKQVTSKLAAYGLEEIEDDEWYSLKIPLAMLYDMRDEYGGVRMRNMGRNVPEHVEFPPELTEVENALRGINQAYTQNHRGTDIGFYEFEQEGPTEGVMICENPYPCEFDKGLIKGVAKKFADSRVTVEEVGDQCRAEGGQRCEYRVDW